MKRCLIVLWVVCGWMALAPGGAGFADAVKAVASSGLDSASQGVDGKMDTRWSSDFNDDQWYELQFDPPRALVGVRLHWETAYGRDYDLQTRGEDGQWQTLAQVREGDGGLDEVYFGLRTLKELRLKGLRRGTGWGYSFWEMQLLGEDQRRTLSASSAQEEDVASGAMDGETRGGWRAQAGDAEPWLQVDCPSAVETGGLKIQWLTKVAPAFEVQAQSEGESWRTLSVQPAGGPAVMDVFFARTRADHLRLKIEPPAEGTVGIAELMLKGPDETLNPVRQFEMMAQRLPDGAFPGWLRREQAFWTLSGRPASVEESLLDEHGRVEPFNKSFSVTPLLLEAGALHTAKDFTTTQSLAQGWAPLPAVRWNGERLNLDIEAVTLEGDVTAVRYRLRNHSDQPQKVALLLAVRPLQINPPWQHGGWSPINEARWLQGGRRLVVNGRLAMAGMCEPSATALTANDMQDVSQRLARGECTQAQTASDPQGIVCAGTRYDMTLAPGQSQSLLVFFPLEDEASVPAEDAIDENFFEASRAHALEQWHGWTGDWKLDLPDPRLERMIRSNLAYLRINADGPAVQPGSRAYDHSWIRDGAISATAMLRFGLRQPVRDYLTWFTGLIGEDGFIPFLLDTDTGEQAGFARPWEEHDCFGEYVFLVRQYVELTGEQEMAQLCWPKVKAAMQFMERLIQQRRTAQYEGTEYFGILPDSESHEGYIPGKHSYWDDFWALRGLQDAQALAKMAGTPQDAQWLAEMEEQLRGSLLASIEKVRQRDGLATLPACAELGDFDPTSTAIGVMVADERDRLPADALHETFERYWQGCLDRMQAKRGAQYTPYEVRNVSALLRLGQTERARRLLDYFLIDAVRPAAWNHMAEVVHDDPRTPSYIGDMPHTWVGAGLINAIRDLLLYEERGALVLAAGMTPEWTEHGVRVQGLESWWGSVSYTLTKEAGGEVVLRLSCPRTPPAGFIVPAGVKLIREANAR